MPSSEDDSAHTINLMKFSSADVKPIKSDDAETAVAVGAESFVAALAGVRLPADGSPAAVYSVEGGGMLTRLWVTNADERVWMQVFVDGEKEPSVAFNLFAAVAVGFESGLFAGGEPFGNALFGKIEGGCYLNVHVPFSDGLRITSTLEPGTPAPTQYPSNRNLCKRQDIAESCLPRCN